jgi:hypothetical protein
MFPLTALFDVGMKVLDKFIPDPEAKAKAQQELLQMQQEGKLAELNADNIEAQELTKRQSADMMSDAVGSKDTSQHRLGCAADLRVVGMTPDEVVKAIIASDLNFDQIIREFDRWTHLSIPNSIHNQPRKQALIIDKSGTRLYSSAV